MRFKVLDVRKYLYLMGFDPYPSFCFIASQFSAPAIMISQKRRKKKTLIEQEDYMINLKSELEIRILHKKYII
jgi:uncharacterized membrane protein